MNAGTPTDSEKDQVKLNQQTSSDPLQGTVAPPNSQTPVPAPPPKPEPPANKPLIPLQNDKPAQDIGVGTDNIGVEKKLQPVQTPPMATPPPPAVDEAKITHSDPNPVISPMPPSEPPPSVPQPLPATPPAPQEAEAKIEIQTTDIPIKSYDSSKITNVPNAVPPPPPKPDVPNQGGPLIKAGGGPAATIAIIAVLALLFGATGGFFGFRYWDNLKTAAFSEKSPTSATPSAISESASATDTSNWPIYSNAKYKFSIMYPTGWVASTTDPQAEEIVFASNQESLAESPSGFRVDIVFQDSNGKTLKSWVEANSVTTNETKPIKEVTVSGKTAYQQEQTNIRPAVATYIERPDKIMIITLTAPATKMGEAGTWYNSIINSIVLQ